MKYIIVQQHGIPLAILFDEILSHKFIAGEKEVLSAGMCNKEGLAYGQSITLGLKSRPEDTEIIRDSMKRTT